MSGLRLDRNERVDDLPRHVIVDILGKLPPHCFAASPEAETLYEVISENLDVNTNQVFVTNGITEGIRVLYDFCCEPGDNIVCLHPTYPMYEIYAGMYNVDYRKFVYNADTLFPALESLDRNLDEKTRLLFIANPNLPIESFFSIPELEKLANKCRETSTLLVVDEAYHFFGAPSSVELIEKHENLIIFRTFSKAFGLAGLRIGFMISNSRNIGYFSKSRSIVESNNLSMAVAEYMLNNLNIMNDHVETVRAGGRYFKERLDLLQIRHHGGNVTNGILLFLDGRLESSQLVESLKQQKIYIRGGFDYPFDQCVRVSLGGVEAMKSLSDSLEKILTGK